MASRYVSPGLTRKTGNPVTIEEYAGSDCSGTDGGTSRVLTLVNTELSEDESVYLDGVRLDEGTQYTASHLSSSSTITFLVPVFDTQTVAVNYYT